MRVKEFYDAIGGDYQDALSRFGNDDIIKRFLKKYSSDASFADFIAAVNSGDNQAAFSAAHTLKGVTGNLAFREFNTVISALVEKLRPLNCVADAADVKKAEDQQAQIISCIEKL